MISTKLNILSSSLYILPYSKFSPHVRNFGSGNEKIIKNRLRSVESIQKITKAMKMVAASKLRNDQRRRDSAIRFTSSFQNLFQQLEIENLEKQTKIKDNHVYMIFSIASDKGLCGSCNTAISKLTKDKISQIEQEGGKVLLFGVGDKLKSSLSRTFGSRFRSLYTELSKDSINYTTATVIAQKILDTLDPYSSSSIAIIYNQFQSAISYNTIFKQIISPSDIKRLINTSSILDNTYEIEPDKDELLGNIYEMYLASTIYGSLVDSNVSEQSSRVSAMDNASKNAAEMLSDLTLSYNKSRQSRITMELVEIISGANSL